MTNTTTATATSARRELTPQQWWRVLAGTAVVAAGVDAASKVWAARSGTTWGGRIDPDLNDAYALGSVGGHSLILATVSLSVLVAVLWWTGRHRTWFHPWAVGLLVGGGAVNGIDRLIHGAVTDFLVVGQLVINLADVAIVAGLVVMTVDAARELRRQNAARKAALMSAAPEGR